MWKERELALTWLLLLTNEKCFTTIFLFNLLNHFEVSLYICVLQMRRPSVSSCLVVASLWLESPWFFQKYYTMLTRQHTHSISSPSVLVDWGWGSGECVCMSTHLHTCACLHWPTYRYQLGAEGNSDYFRPINALFILAVSLWLELIAADYTVWKRKDGHQQFRLGDKNIIMQNKIGFWGLELRNSLCWRKIRHSVTKINILWPYTGRRTICPCFGAQ